tara:strand:- start:202 stop:399 length:198 start_codon:yes stop_codon:yes gene_type:complete
MIWGKLYLLHRLCKKLLGYRRVVELGIEHKKQYREPPVEEMRGVVCGGITAKAKGLKRNMTNTEG